MNISALFHKFLAYDQPPMKKLTIGIVGFGNFGQFLGKRYASQGHRVIGTSRKDYSEDAKSIKCEFALSNEKLMDERPDVVVFCTSITSLSVVLGNFPLDLLSETLVVDVLSVKTHPRSLLLKLLPDTADILCTHPMFGPVSGAESWEHLPFMYDAVRTTPSRQDVCDAFIDIYRREKCRMVPMTCNAHDDEAACSQFLTHVTGRVLDRVGATSTSINTTGFESLLNVVDTTKDSFDLFYGLYKYNPASKAKLEGMESALRSIRKDLEEQEKKDDGNFRGNKSLKVLTAYLLHNK